MSLPPAIRNAPPPTPPAPHVTASESVPPPPGDTSPQRGPGGHPNLYNRKRANPGAPPIPHRNHKHIDADALQGIASIDQRIQATPGGPDQPKAIAGLLTELLQQRQYAAHDPHASLEAILDRLDECPLAPTNKQAEDSIKRLLVDFEALVKSIQPDPDLNARITLDLRDEIKAYLKSNRSGKLELHRKLHDKMREPLANEKPRRASAQKMGLETFQNVFPLTLSNDGSRLNLIKALVNVLPNLETHPIADRNAQRRGLQVLDKALDHLPPDDRADILAYLMNRVHELSSEKSVRQASQAMKFVDAAGSVGAVMGMAALIGLHLGPLAPIPIAATAALYGSHACLAIKKQPQGTALYLLQRHLGKLRKDWSKLDPASRQAVAGAFAKLKSDVSALDEVKSYTLKRFFNDPFNDPANFSAEPGAFGELAGRLHHRLVAPVAARLSRAGEPAIRGYGEASAVQRSMVDLLVDFHEQARQAGVTKRSFPANFLENFLKATSGPDTDTDNAAQVVHDAFARLTEMEEFNFETTKGKLLKKCVEMTERLARGDTAFVNQFVGVAQLADADCHNNARQIFKALNSAVIVDKAAKGEDGYDQIGKQLELARALFHEQELKAATNEVLRKKDGTAPYHQALETEVHAAVEIALGKRFGLPDPIQGAGFLQQVELAVPAFKLKEIEAGMERRIRNGDAFVDFLMEWTPLTDAIKKDPAFVSELERIKAEDEADFERAEAEYFAIPDKPTLEQELEFEFAGIKYQSAEAERTREILREMVVRLVGAAAPRNGSGPTPEHAKEAAHDFAATGMSGFAGWTSFGSVLGWSSFLEALNAVPASAGDPDAPLPGQSGRGAAPAATRSAHTALPSGEVRFSVQDIPHPVTDHGAGGDCLFYALGANAAQIAEARKEVADAVRARPDDELSRNRNSHNVLAALMETPATRGTARMLMHGKHAIPNEVYAKLIETPGIYAGRDELAAYTDLPRNRSKPIVVVDSDGTLTRYLDGLGETIPCTRENQAIVLENLLAGAHIALYKTENHWHRIEIDKPRE